MKTFNFKLPKPMSKGHRQQMAKVRNNYLNIDQEMSGKERMKGKSVTPMQGYTSGGQSSPIQEIASLSSRGSLPSLFASKNRGENMSASLSGQSSLKFKDISFTKRNLVPHSHKLEQSQTTTNLQPIHPPKKIPFCGKIVQSDSSTKIDKNDLLLYYNKNELAGNYIYIYIYT